VAAFSGYLPFYSSLKRALFAMAQKLYLKALLTFNILASASLMGSSLRAIFGASPLPLGTTT